MSDVKAVNDIHEAVTNDLRRRRELERLTKPALINMIREYETRTAELKARIDAAYGDQP